MKSDKLDATTGMVHVQLVTITSRLGGRNKPPPMKCRVKEALFEISPHCFDIQRCYIPFWKP